MNAVSIKFQEEILNKVDNSILKHNFNSRTEFIREAVRDKLKELDRNYLIEEFLKLKGKGVSKTNKSDREVREEVSIELMKELEKRFK